MAGLDAQNEFNTKYGTKKTSTTDWKLEVDMSSEADDTKKWDGRLVIDGYSTLTEIDLTENLIDELVIKNCPKLREININDNEFTKVDLSEMNSTSAKSLKSFFANNNKLEELNLKNCNGLEVLMLSGNPNLKKVKGLEDIDSINNLEMNGTPVRLIHEDKFGDYSQIKETIKDLLGGSLDSAKGDDGKINKDKLKGEVENKAADSVLDLIGKEAGLNGNDAKDKDKIIAKVKELVQQATQAVNNLLNEINGLGLKLTGTDITKDNVIAKIKDLIENGSSCTHTDYDEIKKERDKLRIDSIKKADVVKSNKEIFGKLGISASDYDSKVGGVSVTASEAEKIGNELIEKRFGELSNQNNTSFYLNIGLSVLMIMSLAAIIYLLLRENKPKIEPEPEKKEPTKLKKF